MLFQVLIRPSRPTALNLETEPPPSLLNLATNVTLTKPMPISEFMRPSYLEGTDFFKSSHSFFPAVKHTSMQEGYTWAIDASVSTIALTAPSVCLFEPHYNGWEMPCKFTYSGPYEITGFEVVGKITRLELLRSFFGGPIDTGRLTDFGFSQDEIAYVDGLSPSKFDFSAPRSLENFFTSPDLASAIKKWKPQDPQIQEKIALEGALGFKIIDVKISDDQKTVQLDISSDLGYQPTASINLFLDGQKQISGVEVKYLSKGLGYLKALDYLTFIGVRDDALGELGFSSTQIAKATERYSKFYEDERASLTLYENSKETVLNVLPTSLSFGGQNITLVEQGTGRIISADNKSVDAFYSFFGLSCTILTVLGRRPSDQGVEWVAMAHVDADCLDYDLVRSLYQTMYDVNKENLQIESIIISGGIEAEMTYTFAREYGPVSILFPDQWRNNSMWKDDACLVSIKDGSMYYGHIPALDDYARAEEVRGNRKMGTIDIKVIEDTPSAVGDFLNRVPARTFVFPNPASESVSVKLSLNAGDQAQIFILDGLGQVVWRADQAEVGNQNTFDMQGFSAGAYFVKVVYFHDGKTTKSDTYPFLLAK